MTQNPFEFPVQTRLVQALLAPMELSLHGMPDQERTEHLEHWRGHLSLLHADDGPIRVLFEFIKSTTAHIAWRLTFGPPSALLPGAALLLVGFATAFLAVTSAVDPVPNLTVSTAALFLGLLLVRHPRVQPRRALSAATMLGGATCVRYSIAIARDIWAPSDWFIVLGTALIGVGLTLVSLGASRFQVLELQKGRSWGFGICAIGAGSVAVAELNWLLQGSGTSMVIGRSLTAVAMLATAFTAWRIREVPQEAQQPFQIQTVSKSGACPAQSS